MRFHNVGRYFIYRQGTSQWLWTISFSEFGGHAFILNGYDNCAISVSSPNGVNGGSSPNGVMQVNDYTTFFELVIDVIPIDPVLYKT